MTQEQVKYRLATINEAINDMVDANVAWDRKEVENFDWDYFYDQLDVNLTMLRNEIGPEATSEFCGTLIEESEEENEFDEWQDYATEFYKEQFQNSL